MDDACYDAVSACLPVGTIVVDSEDKISILNPALERLLGGRRDALVGQPLLPFLEHKTHKLAQALSLTVTFDQALVSRQRTDLELPAMPISAGPPCSSRWRALV